MGRDGRALSSQAASAERVPFARRENDITYSVAWALANSRAFLDEFLREILGLSANLETVVIRLQAHEKQAGDYGY